MTATAALRSTRATEIAREPAALEVPDEGRSRGFDLLEPQNLLTAARVPLAVAFAASVRNRPLAFALLAAAGLTDMADGWLARRRGRAGGLGAVLDPVSDKIFATSAIGALVVARRLPAAAVPLLLARELLVAPLAVRDVMSAPERRRAPSANRRGKLTTVLQFATLASAIAWPRATWPLALVTAAAGVAAGLGYWSRALSADRR